MKRLLYCLLAVSFFLSCKQKSLKDQFSPFIQGGWVKKAYIDSVLITKSPAAMAQMTWEILVLNVNTAETKGDSLIVRVGKAAHQLTYATLYFRPGKKPNTVIMSDTDVGYHIVGKDTIMTLYFMLRGKPDSMQYIKAVHSMPRKNVGDGLDTMLNKGLIAGKYNLQENGITKEVDFAVNSNVTGLGKYKTYYINNDFIKGMHNVDGLTMDMHTKQESGLAFKIKADTLDLYTTYVNEKTEQTTLLALKYHLVRKK